MHSLGVREAEMLDLVLRAALMRYLSMFTASQTHGLCCAGRELYNNDYSSAKRKVVIGAGLFLGSAAIAAIAWSPRSTDDELSVASASNLSVSFGGGLVSLHRLGLWAIAPRKLGRRK